MKVSLLFFPVTSLLASISTAGAFQSAIPSYANGKRRCNVKNVIRASSSIPLDGSSTTKVTETLFDFSSPDKKKESVESFERIDDAIMGGISTSVLRDVEGENYASWSGVCRTEGGGFCGCRSKAFFDPINVTLSDGIFIDCRLASDKETEKRIWKLTVRTDKSRGETVYQTEFKLPAPEKTLFEDGKYDEMKRIYIPFKNFRQVRGARLVTEAVPLNTTGGLYQIGMTLSKFIMANNMTELADFRDGYFEMHLGKIGLYSEQQNNEVTTNTQLENNIIRVKSEKEAQKQVPIIFRLFIRPILKLVFSEKAKRRKIAMQKLMTGRKQKMTLLEATLFGIKSRSYRKKSVIKGISQSLAIILADFTRVFVRKLLKVIFFYPLVFISRTLKFVNGLAK